MRIVITLVITIITRRLPGGRWLLLVGGEQGCEDNGRACKASKTEDILLHHDWIDYVSEAAAQVARDDSTIRLRPRPQTHRYHTLAALSHTSSVITH